VIWTYLGLAAIVVGAYHHASRRARPPAGESRSSA